MSNTHMHTAVELLRRSLNTFLAKDMKGWTDLCDDNVVAEFPFAPEGSPTRLEGRAALYEYLRNYPNIIDVRTLPSVRTYSTDDANVAIAEWSASGRVLTNGNAYEMSYATFVTFRAGLIVNYREYWNPMAFIAAMSAATVLIGTQQKAHSMNGRLRDKVCIITGTGGSIGRAAALRFAEEGAWVVGSDTNVTAARETVALVLATGGRMLSLEPVDLTTMSGCQQVVDFAVHELGRIDVLFNNAAMAHFNWIEDITEDEWRQNTRDEVDIVFFMTKVAWPHLKISGGTIVNNASLTGWRVFPTLGGLAHATAKLGIVGMTKQLAMEGRAYGMRANSISPGVIETTQTREQLKDKEWADYMLGKTLVGRLGKPHEVANVAVFLASDESSFVTGVDIKVDGGMSVW